MQCPLCNDEYYAKGYCKKHYEKQVFLNDPEKYRKRKRKEYEKNKESYYKKNRRYRIKYKNKEKERKKIYNRNHPEKRFQANMRCLQKISESFNITLEEYQYALRAWSQTVRKRDNHECQICKTKKKLNAHHIFYKYEYPQLSLNLNNGITLCVDCHSETHGFNVTETVL